MKKFCLSEYLLSCALSVIILLTLRESVVVVFPQLPIVLLVLGWNLLMQWAVRHWKIVLAVLSAAILLLALWVWRGGDEWIAEFIEGYLSWVKLLSYGQDPAGGYKTLSLILLTFAFSLPMFMLIRYNAHILLVLVVGMSVFVGMELASLWYPWYLLWAFLLLALLLALRQGTRWGQGQTRYLLCMAPVCALLLLAVSRIPAEDAEPFAPALLESAYGWMPSSGHEVAAMGIYSFNAAQEDFDGERKLGGRFQPSTRTMLYLQADKSMYVRGGASRYYDGSSWSNQGDTEQSYYQNIFYQDSYPFIRDAQPTPEYYSLELERMQFMYMVNLLDTYGLTDLDFTPYSMRDILSTEEVAAALPLYTVKKATLHYWNINTQSIFVPDSLLYTDYTMFSTHARPLINGSGSLSSTTPFVKEDYFDFLYLEYPFTSEFRDGLLNLSYPGFIEDVYYELERLHAETDEVFLNSHLVQYHRQGQQAYDRYLQLPDIPKRVTELAQEITKDAQTTHQKAKAIERYLSTTYPYSMDTPNTPAGEDFVDYFLFELKTGYCTYYATAMVVMCRALGIPARYVEGFVFSPETYQGFYVATGADAHAWAEVYLDGMGWISYEPTAGFGTGFYDSTPNLTSTAPPTPTPVPTPTPTPRPTDEPGLPSRLPPASAAPTQTAAAPQESEDEFPWDLFLRWLWPVLAVLAVTGWLCFRRYRRIRFLRRLDAEHFDADGAVAVYHRCLRIMRLLRLKPSISETTQEFARRCDQALPLLLETMTPAADAYDHVTFGQQHPGTAQREAISYALHQSEAALAGRCGKATVWVLRYVIGIL